MSSSCCSPSSHHAGSAILGVIAHSTSENGSAPQSGSAAKAVVAAADAVTFPSHQVPQAHIPAGTFAMGDGYGDGNRPDGEDPVHPVYVSAFDIDTTSVTVANFARFVDATGYRTDAETFGYSAVFHLVVAADDADIMGRPAGTPWWVGVRGADWRHPDGSKSDIANREDHPVVHVSWNDAQAYCAWAGRRLPTEAEWERASRGGLEGARFPWGDELLAADGNWRCNIWQGTFPTQNTAEDGWITTAPVHSFSPNGFGLWQTVGNVWEWCADWFNPNTYASAAGNEVVRDPQGPGEGELKVLRGGSYLCHDSYCNRYRNSARSSNTPNSSMGNAGFRTVAV
jgi:formylglycine-generating enzyme